MAGLNEATAYLDGSADPARYRVHVPDTMNVKAIRSRLGLSQETFAATYGFAVTAVRDWEQGRRQPDRSARHSLEDCREGAGRPSHGRWHRSGCITQDSTESARTA